MTSLPPLFAVLFAVVFAAPPAPAPVPTCDYCGMWIEQPRFGARMLTLDHQALRFDAVECLAAFTIRPRGGALAPVRSWVVRWDAPGTEVDARKATYLLSDQLPSPMSVGLSAFASRRDAEAARAKHPGRLLNWDQVVTLVKERWFQPAAR